MYLCTTAVILMLFYMCSCITLKFNSVILELSRIFSIHFSPVAYMYTSNETIATYLKLVNSVAISELKYESEIDLCEVYIVVLLYNYLFVSCNLTTGTPRPFCSRSCYFVRNNCRSDFDIVLKFADVFKKDSIVDDCENTFHFINTVHNFANSSKDFEDDCIDFPGRLLNNI